MEHIGDGTAEDAVGLAVQCLQRPGRQVYRNLAGHKQILVKDEFHFRIIHTVLLDPAWARVKLQTAAAPDGHFQIQGAPCGTGFTDIRFRHRAKIAGDKQIRKAGSFQFQRAAGKNIEVPQTDPLEIGGPIQLDKGSQRFVYFAQETEINLLVKFTRRDPSAEENWWLIVLG